MRDKDQQFIFNEEELSLIKNTFAENDTLLYTIRKVFLQFDLTEPEKNLIKMSVTPDVLHVLKKRILPEIGPEYPLGQLPSLLTTLTKDLQTYDCERMEDQFAAKQLEIDYLTQQFKVLEDLDAPQPIKLKEMAQMEYVMMTAYLFLLGYIDPSLNMIKILAGEKIETPEDQKARLLRDSSK